MVYGCTKSFLMFSYLFWIEGVSLDFMCMFFLHNPTALPLFSCEKIELKTFELEATERTLHLKFRTNQF